MKLPLLEAPARGAGCIARGKEVVDLGAELGTVEIIISSCQRRKWDAGHKAKIADLLRAGGTRVEIQQALQSWIDGGSPCDMRFAQPTDRRPWHEAMADEAAHFGGQGAIPASVLEMLQGGQVGEEGPVLVVIEMVSIRHSEPGIDDSIGILDAFAALLGLGRFRRR